MATTPVITGPPERTVLFLCVENACRSLMAETMFNAEAPPGWRALSAGTLPAAAPNPRTRPMLREIGLDVPDHAPRAVTNPMMDAASVRVSMGCLDSQSCPARLRTLPILDWELPDPARLDDAGFRGVRDEIRRRVRELILQLGSAPVAPAPGAPS